MSSYLQEILTYLGCGYVFEEASDILEKLFHLRISAKQIERVSEGIGQKLEDYEVESQGYSSPHNFDEDCYTYVEVDGSMLFTREDKWKEVKLGRVFQLSKNECNTEGKSMIEHSEYRGYLGDSSTFFSRFKKCIPPIESPIFIADGASWIWKWVKKNYPNSIQILDYYHAIEYAYQFANEAFEDSKQRKSWIEGVNNYLFTNRVRNLIQHFEMLEGTQKGEALRLLKKLRQYYQNNQDRMLYGFYKEKNMIIGSGAIESAHRMVIQKRMKLSGQRWSKRGAQAILQLRTTKNSDNWNRVISVSKTGKVAA